MVSTLSTSKLKISLIALLLGGGFSCAKSQKKITESSPKKEKSQNQESTENKDKDNHKESQKEAVEIDAGPSAKASKDGFIDVTKALQLNDQTATHLYAVDWDGDGHTDLVTLPEYYDQPVFYRFDPVKKIFKREENFSLPGNIRASFLTFADFDRDGKLDLIVATLNQRSELNAQPLLLFKGQGSGKNFSYKEIPDAFPNHPYATSSLSMIDINMDGAIDLYLGNWYDTFKNPPQAQPDRIYLGTPGKLKWVDASYLLKGEHEYNSNIERFTNAAPTNGTSVCDLDKNGFPDILTASASGHSNKVWLNRFDQKNNDRVLEDFGTQTGLASDNEGTFSPTGGGNSFYMLCHDYNNDSFIDVAKGELFHSYDSESRDRSTIMTGKTRAFPPQFIRTEYHKDDGTGQWSQGDRRAQWIDFNFDSFTDLLVENSGFPPKSRLIFFVQGSDHSYADEANLYGIDIVNPSGVVALDYDQDGRPDFFSGQVKLRNDKIKAHIYAFKNDFSFEKNRVLKIDLHGLKANAHGLGATVVVSTDKNEYLKIHDPSIGPLNSQGEFGLWFGLPRGEYLRKVEVRWPYVEKTKGGRSYPLRRSYNLRKLSFKNYQRIILKDDGTWEK